MPRVLQLVALTVALLLVGAPAIVAELLEDDCADECVGDEGESCPEEGCTDCSVVCSACARTHVVTPTIAAALAPWLDSFVQTSRDAAERVPVGPPPEGVFHPPRIAG